MATLYGESKTDAEITAFVRRYADDVRGNPHDRYHSIMELLPDNGEVLDYGCGWGLYSADLSARGSRVVGTDLSSNEVEIARTVWGENESLSFRHAEIGTFAGESFGSVLSNQVVEHVHNVGTYLSGINRVLKPGGTLIISTPNICNPRHGVGLLHSDLESRLRAQSRSDVENYSKTHHHINAWDPGHFVTLLASVGFEMERYIPTEGVALPFWRIVRRPYLYMRNGRLRNLSYTMTFRFKKVQTCTVGAEE